MRSEAVAHLWDAMEAARAAHSFVAGVDESDYLADLMRRSAASGPGSRHGAECRRTRCSTVRRVSARWLSLGPR